MKVRHSDTLILLLVFVMTVFNIIGLLIANTGNPAIIEDYGNYYLVFWYPLLTTVVEILVSLFLLILTLRMRARLVTKLSACFQLIIFCLYLGYIIISFSWDVLYLLVMILSSVSIGSIISLLILGKCRQRHWKLYRSF